MRHSKKGILHELQNYDPKAKSEEPTPKESQASKDAHDWLDEYLKEILKPSYPKWAWYKGRRYLIHKDGRVEEIEPEECEE